MVNAKFYDGTKLLSMKDINGNTPEIYLCTTNRSGGKTTYFNRLAMNRFFKHNEKFGLLYRFNYELDGIADKFFKDISTLFFPQWRMISQKMARGIYHELYIVPFDDDDDSDRTHVGYALSLNNADQIKKYSHLFSDIDRLIFDEFQSETNHYCANEISKFISVHTSIARGRGKQSRYVPVYMIGNSVSLINPYFVELGIASRLNKDTKFLRGNGFVLEQGFIESASQAQNESLFNRAFSDNKYVAYASQGLYLNDNIAFIEKPTTTGKYIATIKYNGDNFAVREFSDEGFIYVDHKADLTFPLKISVTTEDHNINYVMLKTNDILIFKMRYFFDHGCFRFKDLICKEALMALITY